MDPCSEAKVKETTIHRKPRAVITKRGEAVLIRTLDEKISQGLVDMYLAFQPRNSFQGLPPLTDAACVNWARHVIQTGINLVGALVWRGRGGTCGPVSHQRRTL